MAMAPNSAEKAKINQQALMKELNDFLAKSGELRPTISDRAAFDLLVDVVNESTRKNENVAQLVSRLEAAGTAVKGLAKTLGLIV